MIIHNNNIYFIFILGLIFPSTQISYSIRYVAVQFLGRWKNKEKKNSIEVNWKNPIMHCSILPITLVCTKLSTTLIYRSRENSIWIQTQLRKSDANILNTKSKDTLAVMLTPHPHHTNDSFPYESLNFMTDWLFSISSQFLIIYFRSLNIRYNISAEHQPPIFCSTLLFLCTMKKKTRNMIL